MISAIADRRSTHTAADTRVVRGSATVPSVAAKPSPSWTVYYRDSGQLHEWRGGEPVWWHDPIEGAVGRMKARAEAGPDLPYPPRHAATAVALVPTQRNPSTEEPLASRARRGAVDDSGQP
jgi:hypothetical protein